MPTYQICTLVTDPVQYAAMKTSFLDAGFDETRCLFSEFDNTAGNRWDPYAVISQVLADAERSQNDEDARYIIFCHQDVVLDQGHGFDQLTEVIETLDARDEKWAVAGNCGVTRRLKTVRHIADPYGVSYQISESLPLRVITLDENFLVVKIGMGLRCSTEMQGFHLYGTDLCLHALVRRLNVYVIDFRLTHNSSGTVDERFYEVQRRLQNQWNGRFVGAFIASPINTFALSRFRMLSRLLDRGCATNFVVAHAWINVLLLAINRPFFGRR